MGWEIRYFFQTPTLLYNNKTGHLFLQDNGMRLTICKAPSFCLGSAFGDVRTCIIKCTVFCNMSFLCLHEVCSNDWAAVTGDTKSSNISGTITVTITSLISLKAFLHTHSIND